ncbi:MAG: protein kinase domain-containing protein [Thermomicrobiales bacterium]
MDTVQVSDQQRIGERYELRECIGIGGMARVYLAHDRVLNREVAVKILNPALAADPLFVERFRREAQAAAALNHPNIVTIYDTGTTDDTYFIVMEYVPGPNLKEIIRAHGPLPEGEALTIGAQVAAALGVAHAHHLIHRDIKPHNILRGPEGSAKVTDFGIARAAGASQLTATQTVMGTAHYLSPEQALHQPLDGRSDLYSLGVVLYEALTGRVPFDGDSLVAVAMSQVHDSPPPMRQIKPDISPRTEAVVMRALAKDPAARYQSAAEMGAALLAASGVPHPPVHEPTQARPSVVETAAFPPAPPPVIPQAMPNDGRRRSFPPAVTEERRSRRWLVLPAIAALCALVALAGLLALHAAGRGTAATAAPTSVARVPTTIPASAVIVSTIAPTSAPLPTATQAPQVVPTIAPTAVAAVPTAAATIAPTVPILSPTPLAPPPATALPAPTETAIPPTALPQPTEPPVPPTANAPIVAVSGASSPAQAVQLFYQYVGQHQFDQAAQLWTAQMRAQYPPSDNINDHFDQDQRVDVAVGNVTMTGNGQATVAVTVTESRVGGPLRSVGSWQVVRGPSGWLLAQPNLRSA